MCASFCPVEGLIIERVVRMVNTTHQTLCASKAFLQSRNLHDGAALFVIWNLWLFHLSANTELNASLNQV
jgi:hypothetical protein